MIKIVLYSYLVAENQHTVFSMIKGITNNNLQRIPSHCAFLGTLMLLFCQVAAKAQSTKAIQKALEKQQFDKVGQLLAKRLNKDSLEVGGLYLTAQYLIDTASSAYDIDKAHTNIMKASATYSSLDGKTVSKLAKSGVSDIQIEQLKKVIDSLGYARSLSINTEEGFQYYIDTFVPSLALPWAIEKRDSIAFAKASEKNTYLAYQAFFEKYPNALQVEEAKTRFHRLQFEVKTGASSVESYTKFIEEHPNSPYRKEAEAKLYDLFTTDNKPATYARFLSLYPKNILADRAWVWLWFLSEDKTTFLEKYPNFPDKQFAENYIASSASQYFAFFEPATQKLGFIDEQGQVKLPPNFEEVQEEYLCEGTNDDFLVVYQNQKAGAFNKVGNQITPFEYDEIESFSPGVLLTRKGNRYGIAHKGGFIIISNKYESIEYLSPSLIKVRVNGKWGIQTFNDKLILPADFAFIGSDNDGKVIKISNGRKFAFTNEATLLKALHSANQVPLEFAYDDYELNHEQYLNLEMDAGHVVKDFNGTLIIPKSDYIRETPMGWLAENVGFDIYDLNGQKIAPVSYQDVLVGRKGYGVKYADKWGVIDAKGSLFVQHAYDTMYFIGETGILLEKGDKKQGYFYNNELTDFSQYKSLEIQIATFPEENKPPQKIPFIVTEDKRGRRGLLTGNGTQILANRYKQVTLTEEEAVIISLYGKKGLMNLRGQSVLKPAYDGITYYKNGYFSIFRNKKFGLYDKKNDKLINPSYDALLKAYGNSDSIFIAKKGKFGLINKENESITEFIFDEIRNWNDSVILVKHDTKWKLYDFAHSYFVPEVFDTFEYLKNEPDEVILITYRSSGYGLLSSQKGRLIPEEYSDIINLGTKEKPFYLVEKEIVQAGKFVLLYIDQEGKVIKDQVLDNTDYKKIACDE